MKDRKKTSFRYSAGVESFFSVKMLFYKIKQNKRILADLNRRVEFVDKLLFMESLVTGWEMCGKCVGKLWERRFSFSMIFPCIIHAVINDGIAVYP